MDAEKLYVFNGKKFIDYIDPSHFVDRLYSELKIDVEEYLSDGFSTVYETLINQHRKQKRKFDKIFFEEIFYGRLTHAYIHKISTSIAPSTELFLKRVERVLDSFKGNTTTPVQAYMNTEGFYIMDLLNVSKVGGRFLAGFDYTENKGSVEVARFLMGINVMRTKKLKNKEFDAVPEYLLAAVEIDFSKRRILIMHKHTTNVQESQESEKLNTASKIYGDVMERIISPLGIDIKKTSREKDQEHMSTWCKFLVNTLIDDVRDELKIKTDSAISNVSSNLLSIVKDMQEGENKITKTQQDEFEAKVSALLLGIFVVSNYNAATLSTKAKVLKLPGYPTRISYKNTKSNKSSTGNHRVDQSIITAETLYSLLTDFEGTKHLEKWSMAWFTDCDNLTKNDAIQTTIESKTSYFKVTFNALRHLNKELIHNVIDELDSHRNY